MTDKTSSGLCRVLNGRAGQSRTSKVSHKKKSKTRMIGIKQSESPSYSSSSRCFKDFTTPKRRSRIRYNSCYSGDSPETESLQDIIWDPNSPTQNLNGKKENGRVIEISEIVNRIAPKNKEPAKGDSVLQWIGDSTIPCTPEIRPQRVRRISARQSNVEGLKKLAKQFDINMIRQDKEKEKEKSGHFSELLNSGNTSDRAAFAPLRSQALQEEELQALFDCPTQHISGRLSPSSAGCSPVNRVDQKSGSTEIQDIPPELEFDDDWENDDILNDSFVLEMTRKPLKAPSNESTVQNESSVSELISSSTSCSKHTEDQTSVQRTFTSKLPVVVHKETTEKLPKTVLMKRQPASSLHAKSLKALTTITIDFGAPDQNTSHTTTSLTGDTKPIFDSDDDDLLYQACDDVERISASQELQSEKDCSEKVQDGSRSVASQKPFAADTRSATNSICHVTDNPAEPLKFTRSFVRSNSAPPSKESIFGLGSGHTQTKAQIVVPQRTTGSVADSRHSSFKRHHSDSMAITSKVKCSAGEIERKKQEAIARRRLRLQAAKSHGAAK